MMCLRRHADRARLPAVRALRPFCAGEKQMLKSLSGLCALAVLCMMLMAPQSQASPATEAFIQQSFDKGYTILNSQSLSDAQRREQFRALLLELAASRRIALFTLGSYAASAAPPTVDAFVEAFTNYSVAVYEKGLNRYEAQALKVTGSMDRGSDDSVVQAELVSASPSNGQVIKMAFRVRRNETGAPIITDLLIGGVSLATTQRDEFTAYLKQHDGSIPELIKRLDSMADKREARN
jgi:phospholipid transport system substrate-binding protein